MKDLKQFLATCESERLLATDESKAEADIPGGLGLKFGFLGDPKKLKDRSKTKLWKQYLEGNGSRAQFYIYGLGTNSKTSSS